MYLLYDFLFCMSAGYNWSITNIPLATLLLLYSCGKALHPRSFLPTNQALNALAKRICFKKFFHHQFIILDKEHNHCMACIHSHCT